MTTHRERSSLIRDLRKAIDTAVPGVVSIDGMDGVGKSDLAAAISKELCFPHIEVDKFLEKHSDCYRTYVDHVVTHDLKKTIQEQLNLHNCVLVDGVCILSVMKAIGVMPALTIYVKLMNRIHASPPIEWWIHEKQCDNRLAPEEYLRQEYSDEENPLMNCLAKDLCVYHYEFRPQEQAGFLFERFLREQA